MAFVHWLYRLLDIEFLNLHTAGLSRLNVTVHLFLVNKKVTCQFPRILGFNELKAEPTQQRWHQLVHLHQGAILLSTPKLTISTFPMHILGP
jgi:hypothetical protein